MWLPGTTYTEILHAMPLRNMRDFMRKNGSHHRIVSGRQHVHQASVYEDLLARESECVKLGLLPSATVADSAETLPLTKSMR